MTRRDECIDFDMATEADAAVAEDTLLTSLKITLDPLRRMLRALVLEQNSRD